MWYGKKTWNPNYSEGRLLIRIIVFKLYWAMTWRNITMSMQYRWLQSSSSNVIFFWKIHLYASHGFPVYVCNSHKQTFARWYSLLLVIGRVYIYFYHQQGVDKRISRYYTNLYFRKFYFRHLRRFLISLRGTEFNLKSLVIF